MKALAITYGGVIKFEFNDELISNDMLLNILESNNYVIARDLVGFNRVRYIEIYNKEFDIKRGEYDGNDTNTSSNCN